VLHGGELGRVSISRCASRICQNDCVVQSEGATVRPRGGKRVVSEHGAGLPNRRIESTAIRRWGLVLRVFPKSGGGGDEPHGLNDSLACDGHERDAVKARGDAHARRRLDTGSQSSRKKIGRRIELATGERDVAETPQCSRNTKGVGQERGVPGFPRGAVVRR
jgi:hypothetical protein